MRRQQANQGSEKRTENAYGHPLGRAQTPIGAEHGKPQTLLEIPAAQPACHCRQRVRAERVLPLGFRRRRGGKTPGEAV